MPTIASWNDLETYGIDALTGESCGYAMRVLCDVTRSGKELIERFFGGTIKIQPESNWNGGSKLDPHVGSVMLPYSILTDLAAFILLQRTSDIVVTMYGDVVCTLNEEHYERYRTLDQIRADAGEKNFRHITRVWRRSTAPGTGDRNQHMMTGRTS